MSVNRTGRPVTRRARRSLALVALIVASGCVSEVDDAGSSRDASGSDAGGSSVDSGATDQGGSEIEAEPASAVEGDGDDDGVGDGAAAPTAGDLDDAASATLGDSSFASSVGLEPSDDELFCIDRGTAAALGSDRFIELSRETAGGADPVLGPGEAEVLADVFFGCIDSSDLLRRSFEAEPIFAQLPVEFTECLLGEVDPAAFEDEVANLLAGTSDGSALEQLGAEAGMACVSVLTPEQLQELANLDDI